MASSPLGYAYLHITDLNDITSSYILTRSEELVAPLTFTLIITLKLFWAQWISGATTLKCDETCIIVNKSRDVRKPDFCICENKDADQLRGNREADQRLCFRYTDSTIPLLPKSEISSP